MEEDEVTALRECGRRCSGDIARWDMIETGCERVTEEAWRTRRGGGFTKEQVTQQTTPSASANLPPDHLTIPIGRRRFNFSIERCTGGGSFEPLSRQFPRGELRHPKDGEAHSSHQSPPKLRSHVRTPAVSRLGVRMDAKIIDCFDCLLYRDSDHLNITYTRVLRQRFQWVYPPCSKHKFLAAFAAPNLLVTRKSPLQLHDLTRK